MINALSSISTRYRASSSTVIRFIRNNSNREILTDFSYHISSDKYRPRFLRKSKPRAVSVLFIANSNQIVFARLSRRISTCVRFVEESRVNTRPRAFARCRRFLSTSHFLRRLFKEYTFLANGFQDFFFNRLPLIINNKRSVLNTFQHKQIIVKTLLPKG